MNRVTFGADTPDVQHPSDSYFVRLDAPVAPPTTGSGRTTLTPREAFEPAPGPKHRRRRRRKRPVLMIVLLLTVAGWAAWASQRPGGISGTVNGWIEHVRGDVASVSADPDLAKASKYYDAQFATVGSYPQLSDEQLTTAGIGIGVDVFWCAPNAVVLQGSAGGGTVSHLLLSGRDLGAVQGKQSCPVNLANPKPWYKS